MSDFKSRLVKEQADLSDNIDKLEHFLTEGDTKMVERDQMTLLNIQLKAMKTYQACLVARKAYLTSKRENND